jgi:hypothetical protein
LAIRAATAHGGNVKQDAKAIEVLKQMAAFKSSQDQVVIKGVTFTDARLDAGLMVSNAEEVSVSIKRPGSIQYNAENLCAQWPLSRLAL